MTEPRFPRFTPGPGVFGASKLEAIMPLHRRPDGLLTVPDHERHPHPSASALAWPVAILRRLLSHVRVLAGGIAAALRGRP